MEINKIYNMDCVQFLTDIAEEESIDVVLSSPPYNTSRKSATDLSTHQARYEEYNDSLSDEEYIEWQVSLFNALSRPLKKNGVVLYNMSYSSENTILMYKVVNAIITQTDFTLGDTIIWKKKSALPNNTSANKLTRICEFVFVFCKKSDFMTYRMNKEVTSIRDTGQKMYANVFNFILADNNDGACDIHKATYSTDLCKQLLRLYAPTGGVVFDPFMGTGTTAVACKQLQLNYIGTEISKKYCDYAESRISKKQQISLF